MREPMKIKHSYYFHFVEKAAALLLLAYPVLMLTVKGGMNAVFLFMLLLALAVWMVRPRRHERRGMEAGMDGLCGSHVFTVISHSG